ncbi:MAG: cytochrome c [Gammaproteobacteria bacterium]
MKKVLIVISAFAVMGSGLFMGVSAQDTPTPEEQAAASVELRQGLFRLLRFNLGPIAGMAQGAPFDAEVAERNARRIAVMATLIPEVLAADTRAFNLETAARPIVWDNMDDIRGKAQTLIDNANAFADIAAGGDMAQTLGAFRTLGGSCGNCHDTYREDD